MKTFNESLNETYDLFKAQGVSIIGKGYEEVMTDAGLFEAYTTSLTEGMNADSKMAVTQLMANTNKQILTESSVAGITPVASLAGPMIRKLWPMFCLKNAVKTEVATSPAFVIPYVKPYFEDADGTRHYILGGLETAYAKNPADLAGDYVTQKISVGASYDFKAVGKKQPLDADFALVSYAFQSESDVTDSDYIAVGKRLGIESVIVYDYDDGSNAGTILVRVNKLTGVVMVSGIATKGKALDSVKVRAHYSTEYNESATSWGIETARENIQIGTGEHFLAATPIESLQDLNALYQIDGTKEAIDLMTNAFAYQVDTKIYNFLRASFKEQPGVGEFADYATAANFIAVFDVKPAVGFAGGPKAWREELKPVFDHLAARIKNQTHLGNGVFCIVGNPLDVQLITNVDWQFRGGQGGVDGVAVNYSMGTYYGSYTYKVISTEIVPQGVMFLDFLPEGNTQMTYNYWAYSFATELGYRDPNHPMVPAVMMTKRDVLHRFLPAIAAVKIVGNDADSAYDPFRDVLPETTGTEGSSGSATI